MCFTTTFFSFLDNNSTCRTVYTYDYGYAQFFPLPSSSYSQDGSIFFTFSVQAVSDAHLLLSPKISPKDTDAVYEIVLGAGKNTFSDIRRQRRSKTTNRIKETGILSGQQMRQFWVHSYITSFIKYHCYNLHLISFYF